MDTVAQRDSADRDHPSFTRRAALTGLATLAVGTASVGSAAGQHGGSRDEVPMPEIDGPVTGGVRTGGPQTASVADVSRYGYTEEEYFFSGTARPFGSSFTGIGDSTEPASYETRMLVYVPVDRSEYNGTLVVNWPNVTSQLDVPYAWINTFDYMMQEGFAMAIPSVQKQGVDGSPLAMRNWDPVRYTDVDHPGDEYSYDMFSQAINALRHLRASDSSPDPLGGLQVNHLLAMGISQSAGFLLTYINQVQPDHELVDGFMPQRSGSVPSTEEGIRDDLVPIIWQNSEDEADASPRDDGGLFKLQEVPGSSHVNNWDNAWWRELQSRDHGSAAGQGAEASWDPQVEGAYGGQGGSDCPNNLYPGRYAYRAGLHQLHEWVTKNREPPRAPRIEREAGDAKTDQYGNALGGIRLPPIEVPVAEYAARDCGSLFGETNRLDRATLQELYESHEAYVQEMEAATTRAVEDGWLLPSDAEDLLARAANATVP